MSQEQQRRPHNEGEPIKYGDVFNVSGNLASKPIAPRDAAMMQAGEQTVLGETQKAGPAAVMQSAATRNERAGLVGHSDLSDVAADKGITVAETDVPGAGSRIITESVAGQVVGQRVQSPPRKQTDLETAVEVIQQSKITIGEALEACAQSAGNRPVDQRDAAAIQAAEARATGSNVITPGGLAATAQSAADYNARVDRDEDKIKLRDVLTDATAQLSAAHKVVTQQDADAVVSAERRNNPFLATQPGGVAASVAAAARLNEGLNLLS